MAVTGSGATTPKTPKSGSKRSRASKKTKKTAEDDDAGIEDGEEDTPSKRVKTETTESETAGDDKKAETGKEGKGMADGEIYASIEVED